MQTIRIADVSGCNLTDVGIDNLCWFINLTKLKISNTNITDEQLLKIPRRLFKLKKLKTKFCSNLSMVLIRNIHNLKEFKRIT